MPEGGGEAAVGAGSPKSLAKLTTEDWGVHARQSAASPIGRRRREERPGRTRRAHLLPPTLHSNPLS